MSFNNILQKMDTVSITLQQHNQFITQIKNGITSIRAKLQQVIAMRGTLQQDLNNNERQFKSLKLGISQKDEAIAKLTKERDDCIAAYKKKQQDFQNNYQQDNKKFQELLDQYKILQNRLRQLEGQEQNAMQEAEFSKRQLLLNQGENQKLQQNIASLDQKIQQIETVVADQKLLLDPANADVEQINSMLDNILGSSSGSSSSSSSSSGSGLFDFFSAPAPPPAAASTRGSSPESRSRFLSNTNSFINEKQNLEPSYNTQQNLQTVFGSNAAPPAPTSILYARPARARSASTDPFAPSAPPLPPPSSSSSSAASASSPSYEQLPTYREQEQIVGQPITAEAAQRFFGTSRLGRGGKRRRTKKGNHLKKIKKTKRSRKRKTKNRRH